MIGRRAVTIRRRGLSGAPSHLQPGRRSHARYETAQARVHAGLSRQARARAGLAAFSLIHGIISDEEPSSAVASNTFFAFRTSRRGPVAAMSVTFRASRPIIDGDGALIHSSASLPFKPLLTLSVGKANAVPSLAANRAGCDREQHFKAMLISKHGF